MLSLALVWYMQTVESFSLVKECRNKKIVVVQNAPILLDIADVVKRLYVCYR
jgi:hypothetical protein